ncbi:hypothetical protein IKG06_02340 [Candidatus Saccharibacteria bacterium]|nr:hypothetical protein [Candidatus Saccharibacteria bacterium]
MLHKLDPFIRFASDLFGVSYKEGERTFQIKDKHFIIAILGIREEKPRKEYIDQCTFSHLFPRNGEAIIYKHEATSLDKYYRLTDHLDGKCPFLKVADKTYMDSHHVNIPRGIAKTLEKLLKNEGFVFLFGHDYEDRRTVLKYIQDAYNDLKEELKSGPAATDFGILAAMRDFLPQFVNNSSDIEEKRELKSIMDKLAIIEEYQKAIQDLIREMGFLIPYMVKEES